MKYSLAIQYAADLCVDVEDYDRSEYIRGMCEILGELFPVEDMPLDVRAGEILADIKAFNLKGV